MNSLTRIIQWAKRNVEMKYLAMYVGMLVLAVGGLFATLTPPLWGLDEVAHFNRVIAVADGNVFSQKNNKNGTSQIPSNVAELEYAVYADLLDHPQVTLSERKDVTNGQMYTMLTKEKLSSQYEPSMITSAYSPLAYMGPIAGFMIGRAFDLPLGCVIVLSRIAGLITYAAIIMLSIYLLRKSTLKWLLTFMALLPVSVFQASTISADTLTNAFSLLLLAATYLLIRGEYTSSEKKIAVASMVTSVVILPLVKSNSVILSLIILLVPAKVLWGTRVSWALKSGLILMTLSMTYIWAKMMNVFASGGPSMRADQAPVNPVEQLAFTLHHPLSFLAAFVRSILSYSDNYIQSMSGLLGWNLVPLPGVVTLLIIGIFFLVCIMIHDEVRRVMRQNWQWGVYGLLGVASVFGVMYLTFSPVGGRLIDGVNGRYLLPFLPLLIIAVLSYLKPPVRIIYKRFGAVIVGTMISSLLVSVVTYLLATY